MPTLPQTCSACLSQHTSAVGSGTRWAMHVGVLCGIVPAFPLCLLIPESNARTMEPEAGLISACRVMFVVFAFGGHLSCFWAFR